MKEYCSRIVMVVVLVMVMVLPLMAFAMTNTPLPEASPIGQALQVLLMDWVIPVVGAIMMSLATLALNYLNKKNKYLALLGLEDHITSLADKAVRVVEERAKAYAKKTGNITTGKEKLDQAVSILIRGVPKVITKEEATEYIESRLTGIKGLGASGE